MPKRVKRRLPKRLLIMPNKDKKFHEKWKKGRDMLNIPHPFRGVCLGPPNCGKGLVIKNILIRAKPCYQEVYVIHPDPDYTKEWLDIGAKMLDRIPSPEEWKGEVKTLVILDDMEFKLMGKEQKRALDRLFGYCRTHKQISCLLAAQDVYNVPPCVRRCCNLFIFWKMNDMDSLAMTARKTGMKSNNFNVIFNELCKNPHDSLWIDLTKNTPYPLRINGYTPIKKTSGAESKKLLEKMDKFTVAT